MTAKEYLRTHQKAMYCFDTINVIINELYVIRHDKEMIENYYERILQSDKRYEEWENEYRKWSDALAENGGQIGFQRKDGTVEYISTKFILNKGEFSIDDIENIRKELLQVIQEDKSFGHLFNILSKDKNNFITQQEIETAICEQKIEKAMTEETTTTEKSVKIRESISFSDYLTCDDEIKSVLLEYLKQTFAGKGGKGKHYAIMVCALENARLLSFTNVSRLYCSITDYFGDIGCKRGFEKYFTKYGLSSNMTKTHYTILLKRSEIDEHTNKINKKIRELISSQ